MNFCLWITGLPGCGKSTIAEELEKVLFDSGIETLTLNLDEIRKVLTPEPKYSEEERELVYRALVVMAQLLVERAGRNVIIDATGNRRRYRELARELIVKFAEIHVMCPLETAMEREASRKGGLVQQDLYKRASTGDLEGELPGITTPYEAPLDPEVRVDSLVLSPREAADRIAAYIQRKWHHPFYTM